MVKSCGTLTFLHRIHLTFSLKQLFSEFLLFRCCRYNRYNGPKQFFNSPELSKSYFNFFSHRLRTPRLRPIPAWCRNRTKNGSAENRTGCNVRPLSKFYTSINNRQLFFSDADKQRNDFFFSTLFVMAASNPFLVAARPGFEPVTPTILSAIVVAN